MEGFDGRRRIVLDVRRISWLSVFWVRVFCHLARLTIDNQIIVCKYDPHILTYAGLEVRQF